jgi:hypothetical protein
MVRARLGQAAVDKSVGNGRWLVYDLRGMRLRIRLAPKRGSQAGSERVVSWTVTFLQGGPRPTDVAASLGLSLHDEFEPVPKDPCLLRCPLSDPGSGDLHSLTARVEEGRLVELTAFDEPPEWPGAQAGDGP